MDKANHIVYRVRQTPELDRKWEGLTIEQRRRVVDLVNEITDNGILDAIKAARKRRRK